MIQGRSIRLFLADGEPGGIITAEIMNWTGHVMVAPRTRLADFVKRPEMGRTGLYLLTGVDPAGGFKPLLYIGETDAIGKRLAQHNKDPDKEFWETACVVTSKDQNLTKAHVRYLESRLIDIATRAGRAKLVNGTAPAYIGLPEADIADMEFFIHQIRMMLPVLGLEFLREAAKAILPTSTSAVDSAAPADVSPFFELASKKHDILAEAQEVGADFIVRAGSLAQSSWIGSGGHGYRDLHQQLVDTGVLEMTATGQRRFVLDTPFRSPSASAAVILGRQANGRTEWHVKGSRQTYADWQEAQIGAMGALGGDE